MKILITGSEGFIGKSLMTYLKNLNYDVYGLDIKPSSSEKFRQVDILNFHELHSYINIINPEVIIHLAARIDISSDSIIKYDANTIGVSNLIKATEQNEYVKRVIWTSSQLVNKLGTINYDYDNYIPSTSYGESKVIGEKLVIKNITNKEWIIVRPTNVWGPGFSKHYQNMLNYIAKGYYFNVTYKKVLKSYSYIGNICFQYEKLISANSIDVNRKIYYLCDYERIEIRDWINSFALKLGKRKPVTLPWFLSLLICYSFELLKFCFRLNSIPISNYTLHNIKTPIEVENYQLKKITGNLPYSNDQGIDLTVNWFNKLMNR